MKKPPIKHNCQYDIIHSVPYCSKYVDLLNSGKAEECLTSHFYSSFPEFKTTTCLFSNDKLDVVNMVQLYSAKDSCYFNKKSLLATFSKPPSKKKVKFSGKNSFEVPYENMQKPDTNFNLLTNDIVIDRKIFLDKVDDFKQSKYQFNNSNEVSGMTLESTFNTNCVVKTRSDNFSETTKFITSLCLELHVPTREDKKPDSQVDPIHAIFYNVSKGLRPENEFSFTGVIIWNNNETCHNTINYDLQFENIKYVSSESNLIDEFIQVMRLWDPDILIGYEIEMLSWGYLINRGNTIGINLLQKLSKIRNLDIKTIRNNTLEIVGRILLNLWRIVKHEISLQSYTIENISYHILSERVPKHTFKDLTRWWNDNNGFYKFKTINYYTKRLKIQMQLIDKLDIISQTSELAKLFGIQFYEVLSRGSQFRVESMMLRLSKPLNFISLSPNVQQRAKMKAPEFLPLIFEPESKFYDDPILVLDFQSLYPSIIIAYNYCFSTCLGRVQLLKENHAFEFGAYQIKFTQGILKKLIKDNEIIFSPCGVSFVKPTVRQGILPTMLNEILQTRLMVKNSMKLYKDDEYLQKILHSRQLGLKLIANVTYGYTAANFSGRMPCVELGDSVVSKGRETLLRAIKLVEETQKWGAKVVYGDTDSLFVLLKNKSREEAFAIGLDIANAVTNDNPTPVKLKLEKVYQPCILQTKKRYVGYAYENINQKTPVFDAKGIETIRRDGCPAVSKVSGNGGNYLPKHFYLIF